MEDGAARKLLFFTACLFVVTITIIACMYVPPAFLYAPLLRTNTHTHTHTHTRARARNHERRPVPRRAARVAAVTTDRCPPPPIPLFGPCAHPVRL